MVAPEASLLPHTAQRTGVDGANVTTKSVPLVGKYVWSGQIGVKSCAAHDQCALQFGNFSTDCLRIRFSFAWTRVYNSA